jgi:hypothetical protein
MYPFLRFHLGGPSLIPDKQRKQRVSHVPCECNPHISLSHTIWKGEDRFPALCLAQIMSRLKDKAALPLRDFMRRFQVLSLYRNMNRAARQVPDPNLRRSLCQEIRVGFKQNQTMKDVVSLKSTMVEATRQLQQLRSMSASGASTSTNSAPPPPGSWLGDSTPDDERGRVGTDWPWQR